MVISNLYHFEGKRKKKNLRLFVNGTIKDSGISTIQSIVWGLVGQAKCLEGEKSLPE